MTMVDHHAVIRDYWHRRHEPLIRVCVRRSIVLLKALRKNGEHKVWAHKPVTRR